jgi:hypothetical protein
MNTTSSRALLAALLLGGGAWFGLAGDAQATVYNPPIHMSKAGVEYMSGGIGQDEERLMETVEPRWPADFEFAIQDHDHDRADFAASVRVTVRNTDTGAAVIDHVDSRGPFMVARLDPGHYTVDATLGGQTVQHDITVNGTGAAKALFLFPSGTNMADSAH